MINSFHIKNFRSCRDVSINGIGQILALAGWNGAGKTNILEAIGWLSSVATTTPWQFVVFYEQTEGEIVFSAGDTRYRYSAEVHAHHGTTPSEFKIGIRESLSRTDGGSYIFSRDGEQIRLGDGRVMEAGIRASAIPALLSIWPADAPGKHELETVQKFLATIRYYPLDEPSHPIDRSLIKSSDYAAWLAQYNGSAAGANVLMRLVHLALTTPDLFAELKNVLGDNDLSIISDIQFDQLKLGHGQTPLEGSLAEEEKYYFLRFIPSNSRSPVDYNSLSLGTRRVLRIVASVILDESAVMLMEQPEDSIHSGLMKKVIGFLRQYSTRTQIIMATHSPNVFNKMKPEEIRIVHLADGQTKIRSLTEEELAAASQYVHDDGPLSEFIQVAIDDTDNEVWNSQ